MHIFTRRFTTMLTTTFACISTLSALPVQANEWSPDHALRLISPYATGGTNDLLSRLIAQKLTDRLGVPVVVENKSGANGIIGADYVAKAPKDGYTLLMGNSATHGINPNLYAKLPYDARKDFTPIGLIASVPLLLVVNPKLPVDSVKQLVAMGKDKPRALSFASSGIGSSPHLAGELFKMEAGIDILHVPYKGDSPALTDLLGDQVSMMFANMPSAIPMVRSGRLKALAMTGKERAPAEPDIPTMAEAGYPGVEISAWYGLISSPAIPPAALVRLNSELNAVLKMSDVQERIRQLGANPAEPAGPSQFQEFIETELTKFHAVVETAGIALE